MKSLLRLLPIFAVCWVGVFPASAAVFNVTRTDDPEPNGCNSNIDCSLREAVIAANGNSEADSINLPAGTYVLTRNGQDQNAAAGDLDLLGQNVTISGADGRTTIIDAASLNDRIFEIVSAPSLILNSLTLRGGNASGGNPNGGAVLATGGSLFTDNVWMTGNSAVSGGAIFVDTFDAELNNSTLSENIATGTAQGEGGGGLAVDSGNVSLSNSTVSGNQSGEDGGGLYGLASDFAVFSSTVADNDAADLGGGIFLDEDLTTESNLTIANSILATNRVNSGSLDCSKSTNSTASSEGYNIFGGVDDCDVTAGPEDELNVAATGLRPLDNYGGETPTHLLAAGGPAIDHGNPAGCDAAGGAPLATDQRGQNREAGGRCDSGADELGESDLSVAKTDDTDVIGVGGVFNYIVTVTNNGPDVNFNVTLSDDLPDQVSFNSVVPNDDTDVCFQAAGEVSCELGELAVGESATVTISVTAESGGFATNNATVTGTEVDPNPDNDTAELDTQIAGGGGCGLSGAENVSESVFWFGVIGFFGTGILLRGLRRQRRAKVS
jgi:uncharacterized repeat protein (TIGR01451 family)/CSLREA domain-containing protein